MSERGVCICPNCGCQFSDDRKVRLERAVADAAVPMEVLHGQDSLWHPTTRWFYRRVVSESLRDEIAKAVVSIRASLPRRAAAGRGEDRDR